MANMNGNEDSFDSLFGDSAKPYLSHEEIKEERRRVKEYKKLERARTKIREKATQQNHTFGSPGRQITVESKKLYTIITIFSMVGAALGSTIMALIIALSTGNIVDASAKKNSGESAYQIAIRNGFEGSEQDWLVSLVGARGEKGDRGVTGTQGLQGERGETGEKGEKGDPGENAVVSTLSEIPGWPESCSNPSVETVIISEGETSATYDILTCE